MNTTAPEIVLASASPRRREYLERLGLQFTTYPVDVDESLPEAQSSGDAVRMLAERKAAAAAHDRPHALIIAGDTLVFAPNGAALGKPRDDSEAADFLRRLSGSEHTVISGLCVELQGRRRSGFARTIVRMRRLGDAEIQGYVRSGEGRDKAGAYAIQGLGAVLIEEIRGDYSSVVGMPVPLLYEYLRDFGVEVLSGRP